MSWTTANIELDDNQTKKTQKKKTKKILMSMNLLSEEVSLL